MKTIRDYLILAGGLVATAAALFIAGVLLIKAGELLVFLLFYAGFLLGLPRAAALTFAVFGTMLTIYGAYWFALERPSRSRRNPRIHKNN